MKDIDAKLWSLMSDEHFFETERITKIEYTVEFEIYIRESDRKRFFHCICILSQQKGQYFKFNEDGKLLPFKWKEPNLGKTDFILSKVWEDLRKDFERSYNIFDSLYKNRVWSIITDSCLNR
jgi:hypothetical protein